MALQLTSWSRADPCLFSAEPTGERHGGFQFLQQLQVGPGQSLCEKNIALWPRVERRKLILANKLKNQDRKSHQKKNKK